MTQTTALKIEKNLFIFSFLLSIISLFGWILNIPFLVSLLPSGATIKFNTALLSLLLCGSLAFSKWNLTILKWIRSFFLVFIILIAILSFLEYYFNIPFSIDNAFIKDDISVNIEGRMSPATSISFLITAMGVILCDRFSYNQLNTLCYTLFFSVFLIALISLVSFFLFIPVENKAPFIQTMSLPTTLLFLSFSIILMFRKPSVNFTQIMSFESLGSKVFWKFFPIVIVVPVLVSYILLYLFDTSGVNIDFGIALSTNIFIVLSFIHLIYLSIQLNNSERLKAILEERIDELKENEIRVSLLKETHHRVKNNFQIVNSVLSLQANKSGNTELKTIISDCQSRIRAIASLHESIYLKGNFEVVKLAFFLKNVVTTILEINENKETVQLDFNVPEIDMNMEYAMPLGMIVNEIVTNSMKHAFKDHMANNRIKLELQETSSNNYVLTIGDNGIGCDEMENELNNPKSMGSELISVFTEQLNGRISVKNYNGLTYTLFFRVENLNLRIV
jgi:two-component sensor histidine kinase